MRMDRKIIGSVFLFGLAALLGAADPEVWYVHGWNGPYAEKKSEKGSLKLLKEVFPSANIHVEEWNSVDGDFADCRRRADDFATSLTETISALPEERRQALILVGHSLGGRIALRTAAKLSGRKIAIGQAIFLAAAIPVDDDDCKKVFRQQLIPCTNVYCPEDWALRDLFAPTHDRTPLGQAGYDIPSFHHQYCKTDCSTHDAEKYIACLKEHLGKPSDPPLRFDTNIKVKYPCLLPTHTPRGRSPIEKYHGWVLRKRLIGNKYEIVSPTGLLRAEGSEEQMRESFNDIKRQLDEKKK